MDELHFQLSIEGQSDIYIVESKTFTTSYFSNYSFSAHSCPKEKNADSETFFKLMKTTNFLNVTDKLLTRTSKPESSDQPVEAFLQPTRLLEAIEPRTSVVPLES